MKALEAKLAQLIQLCGNLRAENHRLRQELAHALSSHRQCSDQLQDTNEKMESAKVRLEKLLVTLPEEQT